MTVLKLPGGAALSGFRLEKLTTYRRTRVLPSGEPELVLGNLAGCDGRSRWLITRPEAPIDASWNA